MNRSAHSSRRFCRGQSFIHRDFGELESRSFEDVDRCQRQTAVERLVLARQRNRQVHELAGFSEQTDTRVWGHRCGGGESAAELDFLVDHAKWRIDSLGDFSQRLFDLASLFS